MDHIQKKSIKKRKIKHLIRKVFGFLSLFCISFGIFFVIYEGLGLRKKAIRTPLGAVLVKRISTTNQISSLLTAHNISFSSVRIASDSSVLVVLPNDKQAVLSTEKPIEPQISSLQYVISRLTIEGKDFKRIDVRFDRPIISSL